MKLFTFGIFLSIILQTANGMILTKSSDPNTFQRKLLVKQVDNSKAQERKLGLAEQLQQEKEDKDNLNNMKLMMLGMKKQSELRTLETIINDIGDRVEEINDTIRSKAMEFIDKVDSVRNARNKLQSVIEVTPEKGKNP